MASCQCNGARFSRSCRLKLPTRETSIVRSTTTPGSPPGTEQAAQPSRIVEYNGQKPVAKLAQDGSVQDASGEGSNHGDSNQQVSNTPMVRRAQEAASGALPTLRISFLC